MKVSKDWKDWGKYESKISDMLSKKMHTKIVPAVLRQNVQAAVEAFGIADIFGFPLAGEQAQRSALVLFAKYDGNPPKPQWNNKSYTPKKEQEGERLKLMKSSAIEAVKTNKMKSKYKHVFSSGFYSSKAWREVRYQALTRDNGQCVLCGKSAKDGAKLEVDHIKPKSLAPSLALSLRNLQTLCSDCNQGKSNLDDTNFR